MSVSDFNYPCMVASVIIKFIIMSLANTFLPIAVTDAPTAPYTVFPTIPIPGSESFTAGAIAG